MAETMNERIIRLYNAGRMNKESLVNAVKRGILTEGEFEMLVLMSYDEYVNGKAGEKKTEETTETEDTTDGND